MACFLKAPQGDAKGCVVFTTPERDHLISKSPEMREMVEKLKSRFIVGLHHNWHDYEFRYDPLFDFSMAGDGDLVEVNGTTFNRIPLDACNFSPEAFLKPPAVEPFWDVLYVARAVAFKGIPEFFEAVRKLYDQGKMYRVLLICSVPERVELPNIADLRQHFEAMFSPKERKLFTLLTLDWDYPFPLDLESLAFFYRNSRLFVHPAPEERRCRVAAYAWASKLPVVANMNVASILPTDYRRPPFLYEFKKPAEIADTISLALGAASAADTTLSQTVADEFSSHASTARLDYHLNQMARGTHAFKLSQQPINSHALDIRLGRHTGISVGGNRIDCDLHAFIEVLLQLNDNELIIAAQSQDPEITISSRAINRRPIESESLNLTEDGSLNTNSSSFIASLLKRFANGI